MLDKNGQRSQVIRYWEAQDFSDKNHESQSAATNTGRNTNLNTIRTYRDLIVWQKSMVLVTEVYKLTKTFPHDETYGLSIQMRRCAVSIPSNIAEGYGRNSTPEYLRFVRFSLGSLFELQTQLEISRNLGYLDIINGESLYESSREIERMLASLARELEKKVH
jgi:four helix bundle protein